MVVPPQNLLFFQPYYKQTLSSKKKLFFIDIFSFTAFFSTYFGIQSEQNFTLAQRTLAENCQSPIIELIFTKRVQFYLIDVPHHQLAPAPESRPYATSLLVLKKQTNEITKSLYWTCSGVYPILRSGTNYEDLRLIIVPLLHYFSYLITNRQKKSCLP